MDTADFIWMNGEFVAWEDAKVHVLAHGLHYGTGVFEGIRAYETGRGTAIFRHHEHYQRLGHSAEAYYIDLPFTLEHLEEATRELVRRNKLQSCYIRPLAFRGYGEMGLYPLDCPVDVIIATWPWGTYLGEDGLKNGIRAKVSSWRRIGPSSLIPQAKSSGQYLNSILARVEATKAGYEEALLLDERGMVSEGTGENIFVVRDGEIATPPLTASILDGITRKSVIQLLADLGHRVEVRDLTRAELYGADEIFVTGTAAEITPIREVDDRLVGPPGEITRAVQDRFFAVLRGEREEYHEWLDFVDHTPAPTEPEGATVELP